MDNSLLVSLSQQLAAYRFPEGLGYPQLDASARQAILGGNAARLYRIPLPAHSLPAHSLPAARRTGSLRHGAGS